MTDRHSEFSSSSFARQLRGNRDGQDDRHDDRHDGFGGPAGEEFDFHPGLVDASVSAPTTRPHEGSAGSGGNGAGEIVDDDVAYRDAGAYFDITTAGAFGGWGVSRTVADHSVADNVRIDPGTGTTLLPGGGGGGRGTFDPATMPVDARLALKPNTAAMPRGKPAFAPDLLRQARTACVVGSARTSAALAAPASSTTAPQQLPMRSHHAVIPTFSSEGGATFTAAATPATPAAIDGVHGPPPALDSVYASALSPHVHTLPPTPDVAPHDLAAALHQALRAHGVFGIVPVVAAGPRGTMTHVPWSWQCASLPSGRNGMDTRFGVRVFRGAQGTIVEFQLLLGGHRWFQRATHGAMDALRRQLAPHSATRDAAHDLPALRRAVAQGVQSEALPTAATHGAKPGAEELTAGSAADAVMRTVQHGGYDVRPDAFATMETMMRLDAASIPDLIHAGAVAACVVGLQQYVAGSPSMLPEMAASAARTLHTVLLFRSRHAGTRRTSNTAATTTATPTTTAAAAAAASVDPAEVAAVLPALVTVATTAHTTATAAVRLACVALLSRLCLLPSTADYADSAHAVGALTAVWHDTTAEPRMRAAAGVGLGTSTAATTTAEGAGATGGHAIDGATVDSRTPVPLLPRGYPLSPHHVSLPAVCGAVKLHAAVSAALAAVGSTRFRIAQRDGDDGDGGDGGGDGGGAGGEWVWQCAVRSTSALPGPPMVLQVLLFAVSSGDALCLDFRRVSGDAFGYARVAASLATSLAAMARS